MQTKASAGRITGHIEKRDFFLCFRDLDTLDALDALN